MRERESTHASQLERKEGIRPARHSSRLIDQFCVVYSVVLMVSLSDGFTV